jgi:hypothetical protein
MHHDIYYRNEEGAKPGILHTTQQMEGSIGEKNILLLYF